MGWALPGSLILMIQSFPFLLDQGAATTSAQLAAGSIPYPTFHIPPPVPHILHPNPHILFVISFILHPTSNILHPPSYLPPSVPYIQCPVSLHLTSPILNPASYFFHPTSCISYPKSHYLHTTSSVLYPCILLPSSHISCPVSVHPASHLLYPISLLLHPKPIFWIQLLASQFPQQQPPLGDANPLKPKEFVIKSQLWTCMCYAGGVSMSWTLGRTSLPAEFRDDISGTWMCWLGEGRRLENIPAFGMSHAVPKP